MTAKYGGEFRVPDTWLHEAGDWPRHDATQRHRRGLNYWTPGIGPNRLICTAIRFAAGAHDWHPDFTDLYERMQIDTTGRLPWPVHRHNNCPLARDHA